ncbi:MAG: 50S ribosomal protein L23 [Caldimicrobium sp.]|nr:50S ribosomal protein L23 [Caldimicrobium sp.]MCX7873136.1 50S ribosomal protein L23 [Caldimicrobium sp.]MDW8094890.1 50S ribosomal protein L23 [Caldimicrobium sp.]
MKESRQIILSPIITEKAMLLKEQNNQVSFWVDPKANKIEIKRAVEELFKVKVLDVQTIRVKGKPKGSLRTKGKRSLRKKAIVRLAEGQTIEIFETI